MSVRVRYAPSPTGLQHIGGVRTALFNYFFARSQGGKFILRVEDTDRTRYSDESLQDLIETFSWLGIKWDEGLHVGNSSSNLESIDDMGPFGPYTQSKRKEIYQSYANKLVQEGFAYPCFCSAERLDQVREEQKQNKSSVIGYDRHCRELTPEEQNLKMKEFKKSGKEPVLRFKIPLQGKTVFKDLILGNIKRDNRDISPDPIIMKADGFPTYHLANVIDDHLMEITHILRAQEWIPSGPLHVLLYHAFGWEPPQYCHLPMVMGKDGQKLSKRHGSTSLKDFIKAGYLPEALINYVTMVGWAYDGEREFFTRDELEKLFSIEKISKSPGVFDYKKLDWFNGQYIRKLLPEELKSRAIPFLVEADLVSNPLTDDEDKLLDQLIPLVHERLRKLGDLPEMVRFLFDPVNLEDPQLLIPKKMTRESTLAVFPILREFLNEFFDLTEMQAEERINQIAEKEGLKLGNLLMPLRIAVTCSQVSPPIFGVMKLVGKDKVLQNLDQAEALLKSYHPE